ncbi:transposase [Rhodopirellula europaea]|uniref:transposase n=1 Tax=Rhodopirellula europaea TaxID=1263866 RepID=UPI003D29EA27
MECVQYLLYEQRFRRGGCLRAEHCQVINAILWILKTGSPWRELPLEFGNTQRTVGGRTNIQLVWTWAATQSRL